MSDLRQRVAMAMYAATVTAAADRELTVKWENEGRRVRELYLTEADAAIALVRAEVIEEAARVVRRMPSPSSDWIADELLRALGGYANPVPAAIRALKDAP